MFGASSFCSVHVQYCTFSALATFRPAPRPIAVAAPTALARAKVWGMLNLHSTCNNMFFGPGPNYEAIKTRIDGLNPTSKLQILVDGVESIDRVESVETVDEANGL